MSTFGVKPALGQGKNIVLLLTGAFAPIHRGHIETLDIAKDHYESEGHRVVGGIVSPSSDEYLGMKSTSLGKFTLDVRLNLCRRALEELAPWARCDDWEGRQPGFVDYPEVIAHYSQEYEKFGTDVVFLFGSDHPEFSTTLEKYGFSGMCLTREGHQVPRQMRQGSKRIHVVTIEHRYAGISSSKIRDVYSKMHHGLDGIPSDVQEAIPRSIASEIADSLLVDNNQLKRSRKLVNFRFCWCHQRRQAR